MNETRQYFITEAPHPTRLAVNYTVWRVMPDGTHYEMCTATVAQRAIIRSGMSGCLEVPVPDQIKPAKKFDTRGPALRLFGELAR